MIIIRSDYTCAMIIRTIGFLRIFISFDHLMIHRDNGIVKIKNSKKKKKKKVVKKMVENQHMLLEPVVLNNFSMYLMRSPEAVVKEDELKDLVKGIDAIKAKFATIDLGYMELREFNETPLARLLKEHKIPYFTSELPYYVKGHFSKEVDDIKVKLEELMGTYSTLSNKKSSGALELKVLIDRYAEDLSEIDKYITMKVRAGAIVEKIMSVVKDPKDEQTTFVHFGEEKTFLEIMKRLKEKGLKSNVVFIQLAKVL